MQLRFNNRKQLIDALEARRSWAEKHDVATAKKHRTDEDKALTKFRAQCRDLGKLNLVALKDAVENKGRGEFYVNLPTCPMSAMTMLDEVMAVLAITKQETFILNGDYKDSLRHAHWLLTHNDAPRKATVCA